MRELRPVPATPVTDLVIALRAALDGSGPAIAPFDSASTALSTHPQLPTEVPVAVAVVIATSGSSGPPKLVGLRAGALLASAVATEGALGGPGAWVLALPGHYIAGVQVIVRALTAGSEPVLMPEGAFTAQSFAAAVGRMPATGRRYSSLVPTQLHRLVSAIEAGDDDVAASARSLDAILIGGGRLEPALAERAARLGIRAIRTYGSSETAGGCVYDGVPLAGVEVRIRHGEVQLSGPTLADGYLGDEERTRTMFLREPGRTWYRTGDAGTWDGRTLSVTGRLDDVIISGGEKVSLARIESVVRERPGLEEAIVVRAPDAEWGEVAVVATTRLVALAELRAALAERLGRAASPARVLVLESLPMLSSGKPDRRRIAELADAAGNEQADARPEPS